MLATVSACNGSSTPPGQSESPGLRVASFDFLESELLAEVYAQAAERAGVTVVRLGAVGPREVLVPAMRNDHVDLVAEYVGSALRFAGVEDPPDDPTVAASLLGDRVAVYGIGVLAPSAAVDANVFVVSAETARNHDLESVSDLSGASLDRFGGPAECPDRPLCLVGLRDRYGVSFETFIAQPSLSFTAEALRRDEIDVGVMFSTSPELDAPDLVVLTDDRHLQAPENVLPMIRLPALERWGPGLERALDRVSEGLTTHELRRLNGQVADGGAVAEVARQWLDALERSSG
jgi:osmoprotectant transport system substrate-binding protein